MLTVFMLVIMAACVAMLFNQGLWSGTIALLNVVTAALLVTNLFEPVAGAIELPGNTADFVALWVLFGAFAALLRLATDAVSKVNVRFIKQIDLVGGIFLSICIGWVVICFTMTSLHTAPLARTAFGGQFMENPGSSMLMGTAPDRKWLGFVYGRSKGALDCGNVFDDRGEFIFKYAARRQGPKKTKAVKESGRKKKSS